MKVPLASQRKISYAIYELSKLNVKETLTRVSDICYGDSDGESTSEYNVKSKVRRPSSENRAYAQRFMFLLESYCE